MDLSRTYLLTVLHTRHIHNVSHVRAIFEDSQTYEPSRTLQGCSVVAAQRNQRPAMFLAFETAANEATALGRELKHDGKMDNFSPVKGFLQSMEAIRALCETSVERTLYSPIERIIKRAEVSAADGMFLPSSGFSVTSTHIVEPQHVLSLFPSPSYRNHKRPRLYKHFLR